MGRKKSWVKIGYFSRTHGLRGGLVLNLPYGPAEDLEYLYVLKDGTYQALEIDSFSTRPDLAFVKLRGVDSIDSAAAWKGTEVYIQMATSESEFFGEEIVGFAVEDETYGLFGKVTRVAVENGRTFVLVNRSDGGESILPADAPFIQSIDRTNKTIFTSLPEGFLAI